MDLVDAYRQSIDVFTDRVRQVRPEQWVDPTPCEDWDVRTLTNHVVGEDRWTAPLFAGSTIEEVGDRFDGDLLDGDPIGAAVDAAAQARAAVSAPGAAHRTVHLSFGDTPGEEYLGQLLADHLVHTWDLAVAVGVDPTLPEAAVLRCARWFADWEARYRAAGAIGPAVPLPASASPQDRLLAAFGRHPDWTPPLDGGPH